MKRCIAPLLAIGVLAAILTANSTASDKEKKPPVIAPFKLGPEHKLLQDLVGNFDANVKFYLDPAKMPMEMTGTMERTMVLDGNFVQENFKGKFFDKSFTGLGMLGYDYIKKSYVMTWYDNMSTSMSMLQGTYDADKKTYTFVGDEIDPRGKKMKAKDVLKIVSADEESFEMYRTPEGGPESKVMDITYTRAKKGEEKKEQSKQPSIGSDKSGARELSAKEAAQVLGIPKSYLDRLTSGDKETKPKEKLSELDFEAFRFQFGRTQKGLATFQVRPNVYFILISLSDQDRQPNPTQGGKEAVQPNAKPNKIPLTRKGEKLTLSDMPPVSVDHRPKMTPVRDQGERGTCVAFAACADLEAGTMEKKLGLKDERLCENLAYLRFMKKESSTPCKDPGLATFRAAEYLMDFTVCSEKNWPYVSTDPDELKSKGKCDEIDILPKACIGKNGAGIADYLLLPAGEEVDPDGTIDIKDTLTLERLIHQGHNIVFGTIVAWSTKDANEGTIDVKRGPAGQPIFGSGGHAMMMVGYDRTGKIPYFIVKNSWSSAYGHKGYLYLSYDYIRTYGRYGYVTTDYRSGLVKE